MPSSLSPPSRSPRATRSRATRRAEDSRPSSLARRASAVRAVAVALLVTSAPGAAPASPLPSVASINLCADQLVLTLASPEQILTVSWLAADPEESMLAAQAKRYPLNYGTAEELLRFHPAVVISGAYTNPEPSMLRPHCGA